MIKKLVIDCFNSISKSYKLDPFAGLAIDFICHYLLGSKADKSLPEEAIEAIKEDFIFDVTGALEYPSYHALTSTANTWNEDSSIDDGKETVFQWLGLRGVVGTYHYKLTSFTEEGVVFSCWDHWDFNSKPTGDDEDFFGPNPGYLLAINLKNTALAVSVCTTAKLLFGIEVTREGSNISIFEHELVKLNKRCAFITKWDMVINYEEFSDEAIAQLVKLKNDPNAYMDFLMTKEDEQNNAKLNAITKLEATIVWDEESYTKVVGFKFEEDGEVYSSDWDTINKFRK